MQVRADSLDADGRGVCRADGLEIRVENLLPGERAEVEIEHRSPHQPVAWARVVQRLGEPSPDRVEPACPAFGRCGGCSLQHLDDAAQLSHKRTRVEAALGAAVDAAVAAPSALGYRNKGKYVVGHDGDRLVLGAYRPRSHAVVDTLGCRVVDPAIDAMAAHVRDAVADSGLPVYDESARTGQLRHVVIRAGAGGDVLIAIAATSDTPGDRLRTVARRIAEHGARGVVWVRNDSSSGTVVTDDVEPLAGVPTITERIAGVDIELSATEFFQVNRVQATRLYSELAARVDADSSQRAIDLYCGVGGIAFSLAATGARVLGIERQQAAVDAANLAANRAGIGTRVHFVAGTAAALASHCNPPPHIIVVNPPRKGLDAESRAAVLAARPAIIAYVSCGPESLARDVAALDGYQLESAIVFDLMPGTPQVETLVILRPSIPQSSTEQVRSWR